jgi:Polyketide cyclase / dehydrase and lipid transport
MRFPDKTVNPRFASETAMIAWLATGTVRRSTYLLAGVGFFLVKFGIDAAVSLFVFDRSWSPMQYLVWPNDVTVKVLDLHYVDRQFAQTMLLLSLPFIVIGVLLTLARIRDARLPLWLVALFFVPIVNLILFAILVVLPTRPVALTPMPTAEPSPTGPPSIDEPLTRLQRAHRSIVLGNPWRSGLVSLLITVPACVALVVFETEVLRSYAFSLFVGGPFFAGMISVMIYGFSRPQSLSSCVAVGMASTALIGVVLLVLAREGAICLLMAAPIGFGIAMLGVFVGYVIQYRPWLNHDMAAMALLMALLLPTLMAAEAATGTEPDEHVVRTEVVVDAAPEKVWPIVLAFPPLPEPNDWMFRAGIAYPMRAEIVGAGPGAVRRCVFSTGAFVEPIDDWQEPTRLKFRVTESPPPMHEWSPFDVHPPHLDGYLVSRQGEFRLERLEDGRTRLVGSTWYANRMWPASYWYLWSDAIIHRIHERVLNHIREQAEAR